MTQSPMSAGPRPKYNTKNLGLRLGTDLISGASAAVLVAPLISMVDRSIMENASGRASLGTSLRSSFKTLLMRPHTVIMSKPFLLIWLLYGGTYVTANTLDTATAAVQGKPATLVTSGPAKFAASSAANVGLCMYKDQAFVRMFGPAGAAPRAVPLASYALFTARDCMTIFASFNVPPMLGPRIHARLNEEWRRLVGGPTIAQFLAPAAVQFVSTPLHLLGLDLYNRPRQVDKGGGVSSGTMSGPTMTERMAAVRKNWIISSLARICRIVPAFGIGGVVNTKVRSYCMERLA